jgi:hypothetical protein
MADRGYAKVYYQAARELLPEMNDDMRQKIEVLLQQAEQGAKTDNLIVDIITDDDKLRRRLREMISVDFERTLGYPPLGGYPNPPPALKYVCPVEGHEYSRRISKLGEEPGRCPQHHVPLILDSEKKRGT